METKKYPFEEGETYYTVEGSTVTESYWDCGSEEQWDERPVNTFKTKEEAYLYLRANRETYLRAVMQSSLEKIMEGAEDPIEIAEQTLSAIAMVSFNVKYSLIKED